MLRRLPDNVCDSERLGHGDWLTRSKGVAGRPPQPGEPSEIGAVMGRRVGICQRPRSILPTSITGAGAARAFLAALDADCTRVAISKLKAVHADAATHPGGKLAGSRQAAKPGPEGVGSAPGTAEGAEAANSPENQ